jgi:quercetin dioxygenase-like cupin family protein
MKSLVMFVPLAAFILGAAADEPAAPAVSRVIFERHDQTGVPGKEIVSGSVALPPGATVPFHTHPGDEAGFVLKGVLVLHTRGQPDKVLKAGDSFFNVRGAVHSLSAAPGEEGGTAVSAWILDKGQPLAVPAP